VAHDPCGFAAHLDTVVFYPGWEVSVDGKPGRILLADYLLSGVVLPAGAHRVKMHYARARGTQWRNHFFTNTDAVVFVRHLLSAH